MLAGLLMEAQLSDSSGFEGFCGEVLDGSLTEARTSGAGWAMKSKILLMGNHLEAFDFVRRGRKCKPVAFDILE